MPHYWWVPAAAAGITLTGAAILWLPVALPPVASSTRVSVDLGLRAEQSERNLLVTWNKSAPVVQSAVRGTLFVADGNLNNRFDLDREQLTTGRLVYLPTTNDVRLRLELARAGNVEQESLRILSANDRPPSPFAVPATPPAEPLPSVAPVAVVPARPTVKKIVSKPSVVKIPPQPGPFYAPRGTADRLATQNDTPRLPEPPELRADARLVRPPIFPTPRPQPYVTTFAEEEPPSRLGTIVRWLKKRPVSYIAAKPVMQAQPNVSALERAKLEGPQEVAVRVRVTEGGLVDDAQALDDNVSAELLTATTHAARRWRFTPAMRDGEAVRSQMILHFRFDPPASLIR